MMKKLNGVAIGVIGVSLIFCGCASVKEACHGVAGTSTKILDETRPEALRKELRGDYQAVSLRVKESLKKNGCYTYRQEPEKGLMAVYVSESDTTPVGIYLQQLDSGLVRIEIASPSTYAKELLMQKLSGDLKDLIKVEKKETTEAAAQESKDEKK